MSANKSAAGKRGIRALLRAGRTCPALPERHRYTSRRMNHLKIAFTAISPSRLLSTAVLTVCLVTCQGCAYFAPKYMEPSEANVGGPPPEGYVANGCLAQGVAGLGNFLNCK